MTPNEPLKSPLKLTRAPLKSLAIPRRARETANPAQPTVYGQTAPIVKAANTAKVNTFEKISRTLAPRLPTPDSRLPTPIFRRTFFHSDGPN